MSAIPAKIILSTALALIAFAGNSILCRLALGGDAIDASSFTSIRLLSGIVVLVLILQFSGKNSAQSSRGSWRAAAMLFLYAIAFSFAYISLDTGVGALILFGAVQITMILVGLFSGNRLRYSELAGTAIAFFGFVYLVLPTLSTPSVFGFMLMTVAGVAWGLYTLLGRGSRNPVGDTAYNFLRTLPLVLILIALSSSQAEFTSQGILLAVVSGAVTSGLGYTIWYIALGGLTSMQAAALQLLVPLIAAIGGVIFASEIISLRLVISSVLILGGISIVIFGRMRFRRCDNSP